jgi:3-isopropylmalate dehydrogenase
MKTKSFKIAVLAGDGIGPETMRETLKVLRAAEAQFEFRLDLVEAPVGWAGIDAAGQALPDDTLKLCHQSNAILFGSVGLPQRDPTLPRDQRPERAALLRLRKEFNLFANLRPVKLHPALASVCPLRPERVRDGVDILVIRELTAGLYFGNPKMTEEVVEVRPARGKPLRFQRAVDSMIITSPEIERIAHVAFQAARARRRKVTSIDKANILENGILWREVVTQVGKKYPEIELHHMFVDNGAMQLMLNPCQFDVLLCENTFGDILSDEAAALAGSLGMLPSASLGGLPMDQAFGLYEPAGGTAPDIAGKNVANPIAQILSAALMLRHSCGQAAAAQAIEDTVFRVLHQGIRTSDIYRLEDAGASRVTTIQMGDAIASGLTTSRDVT